VVGTDSNDDWFGSVVYYGRFSGRLRNTYHICLYGSPFDIIFIGTFIILFYYISDPSHRKEQMVPICKILTSLMIKFLFSLLIFFLLLDRFLLRPGTSRILL